MFDDPVPQKVTGFDCNFPTFVAVLGSRTSTQRSPFMTIVITGATGNVGRPLVAELAAAGAPVRAVTRTRKAARFPDGVEVVGSAAEALPGASAGFLNSRALGGALPAV